MALIIAERKERAKRYDACMRCPKLSEDKKKCTSCGCWIKAKVTYERSLCPEDRWK